MKGQAISYEARMENLPALLGFVEHACKRACIDPETVAALKLAVEEVCVNIIKHGYAEGPPGPIGLTCEVGPREIRVTVTDEAPLFDPTEAPLPDLKSTWEDRPIGGLGWHLVRRSVDEVLHEATAEGGNQLTLVKLR